MARPFVTVRGMLAVIAATAAVGAVAAMPLPHLLPPVRPAAPSVHRVAAPFLDRSVVPAVQSAATRRACAWHSGAIGKQRFGNAGFIDTAVTYLMMPFGYRGGSVLRIHGAFPYARYMSFATYAGDATTLVDQLTDAAINPDTGSANPFRPFAPRAAWPRSYTLTVHQGPVPATGRAPNTLYTGRYHPILLMYRIYAPDDGVNAYGNVPAPGVDFVRQTAQHGTQITTLPLCTPLQPARAPLHVAIPRALQWYRFRSRGTGGANADAVYLQARLDKSRSAVYVIRFKAPIFADTYHGNSISGQEDVRYWSLCQYAMLTSKVIACLHDYQAVRDRAGYVTVVISTFARKPRSATRANGINWLPFGPERIGMVTYRQLLPLPTFQGSVTRVTLNAYPAGAAEHAALGPYFPSIQTCAPDSYMPRGCA